MSRHSDEIKSDGNCEITCVNEKTVESVRAKMGSDDDLFTLGELFKALGDSTRISILMALSIEELCVCDIAAVTGVSQSAVSHQLRLLRMSRLVRFRKDGKMAYYSLDDDHVRHLLDDGLRHVKEG